MVKISQSRIVDNLNKYLEWNNLPVRMRQGGICNALAAMYAQDFLNHQKVDGASEATEQPSFRAMLDRIASMKPTSELDSQVDHFAAQVALTFAPQFFDKESSQRDAIEILKVEGKSLKSAFEVGLVTSDKNWCTIIKSIALQEDEAMLVGSPRHIITITRKNGEYVVYDPNYDSGVKTFPNEETLMRELHYNVFHEANSKLATFADVLGVGKKLSPVTEVLGKKPTSAMRVQVIRHPSNAEVPREFPDIKELYDRYLTPNEVARFGFHPEITNLEMAISHDSKEAVEQLFAKGFKDKFPLRSALLAITENKTNVIGPLLEKMPEIDSRTLNTLFFMAMRSGHKKAFDELLKDPRCRAYYDNRPSINPADLFYAAKGGNAELIRQIIELYKAEPRFLSDEHISEIILMPHMGINWTERKWDSILAAIHGEASAVRDRSIDCVELLLNKAGAYLDEARLVRYLHAAVNTNQPHMVDLLINKIKTTDTISDENKQKIFHAYTMNLGSVERTDISILRALKDCGVPFSKNADYIFDKKESRATGYLLPMGIMLNKFTDYVKERFFPDSDLKTSIKKYQEFKSTFTGVKATTSGNQGNDTSAEQVDETTPLLPPKR